MPKKRFCKRTDVNEFLREHPMVSDLYDAVLYNFRRMEVHENPLDVFNLAYELCVLIIEENMPYGQVSSFLRMKARASRNYVLSLAKMVVWSMLSVHRNLLEYDNSILYRLRAGVTEGIDVSAFECVVKNYVGTFEKPINFSGIRVVDPMVQIPVGESPQEKMDKAEAMMKEVFAAMVEENKRMAKRIEEMEAEVMLYKGQITRLIRQLERQREPSVITVEKYPEDAIYKAINHRAITDYACGLSWEYPAPPPLVISTMLSKLAGRGMLQGDDMRAINEDIVQIDNPKGKAPATVINNNYAADSRCQTFNGDVNQSKFLTDGRKDGNQ